MILFTILLALLVVIAVITLVITIIAGGSILVIFGDAIVFGLIVWGFVELFRKKKK